MQIIIFVCELCADQIICPRIYLYAESELVNAHRPPHRIVELSPSVELSYVVDTYAFKLGFRGQIKIIGRVSVSARGCL